MGLSKKQRIFIDEYLKCWNATQAALNANYSAKSAHTIGWENLQKLAIKEEIERRLEESAMSADEVLQRLADIARGNITDLMSVAPSGYTIELMNIDENDNREVKPEAKLIKKIKQRVTTIISNRKDGDDREIVETELELYNAQEALNTLGKHYKLFTKNIDLTSGGKPLKTIDLKDLTDEEIEFIEKIICRAIANSGADSG
jgi:phage terminase small subunit